MTDTEKLVVIQDDREAAARWAARNSRHHQAANIRRGSCDTAPIVQAFAKHRIEAPRGASGGGAGEVDPVNYKAWANNMIMFIRERDLQVAFTDWCGGWPYPGQPTPAAATVGAVDVDTIDRFLIDLAECPDFSEIAADGGITVGMVFQQQARWMRTLLARATLTTERQPR